MSFWLSKITSTKAKKELIMQKENFFVDNEIYELATLWVLRAIF